MKKLSVLKDYFGFTSFRIGQEGLIDNIGSLSDALTCLYDMIENNPKPKRSDKYKQEENNNEEEPEL